MDACSIYRGYSYTLNQRGRRSKTLSKVVVGKLNAIANGVTVLFALAFAPFFGRVTDELEDGIVLLSH